MKDDYSRLGFETLSVDELSEYRSRGIYLKHSATGAELYQVAADDDENLFSFAFRTPPSDHTGVPHILEHVVLCGSERYPLKDPFLVMLKGSAHTFLNAMTYPDKTVYPAASVVKADFLNLLRVYADAVFFPQLKPEAFAQEGHRLEFDDEGKLIRAGIVLNEMKGSYSSAESIAGDYTLRSLFPDNPYHWDSGGDPKHISELSYEAFKAFHEEWYHPSNARIFLYGNHNLEEVLSILDTEYLSRFQRREIESKIPLQPRWTEPRTFNTTWPTVPGEDIENKTTISMNWLWGETTQPVESLAAQVLSFILLGHNGSPLQKAIVDSGLGQDLSPVSGLETDIRQMVFSAALRGTDPSAKDQFESLVMKTLESLVEDGLDADLVEGALRSVEFRGREIRGGSPFGMRLMNRAMRGWLHERPPMESMAFDDPMAELRRRAVPGFFEGLIQRDLLANPHRSTVVIAPDSQMLIRQEAAEQADLDRIQGELDIDALKLSLQALENFQETPDSPEDLARIPFLSREDLPREVKCFHLDEGRDEAGGGDISWYSHSTFANGVAYLEMAFDVSGLDPALEPWIPLFGRTITEVGLPGVSHDELALQLAMKIGGLGCSLEASPIHPDAGGGLSLRLFLHLKALSSKWPDALDLCSRILQTADFSDLNRVEDLLLEMRNDYKSAVVPSGHAFAALRASAKHSEAGAWEDLWYGIGQLLFLQDLAESPDGAQRASEALSAIRDAVIRRSGAALAVTADPHNVDEVLDGARELCRKLPLGELSKAAQPQLFRHESREEGLAASTAVSYSALCLPAPVIGSVEYARSGLLAHILKTGFLWEAIRMKGGAYGVSASISGLERTFTFSTYRDPSIIPSLKAFKEALEWAKEELDDSTLDMAVIGSIGKELRPLGPGSRGSIAFKRKLYGISDEVRQRRRDWQLESTAADLREQAAALLEVWEQRSITVIAGAEALDEASEELPELLEHRLTLPS